jgi:hypothetical protein
MMRRCQCGERLLKVVGTPLAVTAICIQCGGLTDELHTHQEHAVHLQQRIVANQVSTSRALPPSNVTWTIPPDG